MKPLFLLAAVAIPGLAQAQTYDPLNRSGVIPVSAVNSPYAGSNIGVFGEGDTPTMRQQKANWSNALRQQVAQWIVEDGGTLTEQHRYYVIRKARRIQTGE